MNNSSYAVINFQSKASRSTVAALNYVDGDLPSISRPIFIYPHFTFSIDFFHFTQFNGPELGHSAIFIFDLLKCL